MILVQLGVLRLHAGFFAGGRNISEYSSQSMKDSDVDLAFDKLMVSKFASLS